MGEKVYVIDHQCNARQEENPYLQISFHSRVRLGQIESLMQQFRPKDINDILLAVMIRLKVTDLGKAMLDTRLEYVRDGLHEEDVNSR